jgi:hypothetical protein
VFRLVSMALVTTNCGVVAETTSPSAALKF